MDTNQPVVARNTLVAGFRELGMAPGGLVMAHSSLSSFGYVEGGAETVIEALLEAISPGGTLVLPTLCQADKERRAETWDIANSPSDVGRITEVFRTWNGVLPRPSGPPLPAGRGHVIRSDHFTHSVTALGPLAEEITSGHATAYGRPSPWGERAFGIGSPWDKLYEHNALYCFLGVTYRVHTMRHYIQAWLLAETISRLGAARTGEGPRPEGARARAEADELRALAAGWNKPGIFPWWNGETEEEALAALGLIRYVQIADATCRSIPTRTDVDNLMRLIREAPEKWLNPEFLPWYLRSLR